MSFEEIEKLTDKDFRCIVCNSQDFKFLFQGHDRVHNIPGEFNVFQCNKCQLVFIHPIPDNLEWYYPKDYYAYRENSSGFSEKIKFKILKSSFKDLIFPAYPKISIRGKILDIGCGTGKTLLRLKKLGWEVYGNDIDASACKIAEKSGIENIQCGDFENLNYPDNFFDCICINNTLEHMRNPVFVVDKIKKKLERGGELIIATPNYESLGRRIFGKHDGIFDLPRHLYLFNLKNLSVLLMKKGFKIKEIFTTNVFVNFHHNLMYLIGKNPQNVFFLNKITNVLGFLIDFIFYKKTKVGGQLIIKAKKL